MGKELEKNRETDISILNATAQLKMEEHLMSEEKELATKFRVLPEDEEASDYDSKKFRDWK